DLFVHLLIEVSFDISTAGNYHLIALNAAADAVYLSISGSFSKQIVPIQSANESDRREMIQRIEMTPGMFSMESGKSSDVAIANDSKLHDSRSCSRLHLGYIEDAVVRSIPDGMLCSDQHLLPFGINESIVLWRCCPFIAADLDSNVRNRERGVRKNARNEHRLLSVTEQFPDQTVSQ